MDKYELELQIINSTTFSRSWKELKTKELNEAFGIVDQPAPKSKSIVEAKETNSSPIGVAISICEKAVQDYKMLENLLRAESIIKTIENRRVNNPFSFVAREQYKANASQGNKFSILAE